MDSDITMNILNLIIIYCTDRYCIYTQVQAPPIKYIQHATTTTTKK